MKQILAIAILSLVLAGCAKEKAQPANPAPAQPQPQAASTSTEPAAEPVTGTWAGQLRIDAHAGTATLNYVGRESGDFVPMRFRTGSEAGAKILAACADEDLCEIEGSVRFLNEPPPENASAVGEIVRVNRVKKLPADAF